MSWTITPRFSQWTPALISTALWLDAADNATVFSDAGTTLATNGSAVQQWNDKSGNGRHATQATAGSRPAYTTNGLNSKNILTFDGINDSLGYVSGVEPRTIVAVAQTTTATTYVNIVGADKASGTSQVGAFYFAGGSPARTSEFTRCTLADTATGGDFSSSGGVFLSGGYFLFLGRHNDSSITTRLNGTAGITDTTSQSLRPVGAGVVGASYYSGALTGFWPGTIAEIIISSTAESDLNIQRLEGYLAHKWGLTANLPANHPYKVNPPAP